MDFLSALPLPIPLPPIAISFAVILLAAFLAMEKRKRYPPIAGTLLHILINYRTLHHYMAELACKYKTYRVLEFFRTTVYSADPANVEYVFKTNVANYGKGTYLHDMLADVFGDGIYAVDGEKWRHQRKASSSQFSTKVLRNYSSEVFRNHGVKLAGIIHQAATCNKSMDIQDLLMKSTLDSVVEFLLGIDPGTISAENNEESVQFTDAMDYVCGATLNRGADIFWKIKRFLNIGTEAMLRKNMKVVDQFIYQLVNRKMETLHNSEDGDLKKADFFSRLLDRENIDPQYLRDTVFSFIAAGQDTTACALSWFIYMMCKHHDIQEKIAQEVREATGQSNSSSAGEVAANLTEEALNKMQYLHAALTETLRLYPVVPMNPRECFSDDTWPDGYSVKKGQWVIFSPYSMGRMKSIWGDDATEFRPERWLDENGNFREESLFKFTAFNVGPRMCLGKEYSYIQMKIYVAILINSYIFNLNDEKQVVKYKTTFTLHINKGLHVRASPRV